MILSAGLSPAWQHIVVFDAFRRGAVNRACESHWCTSGKVCNVGNAVHHLGGPSLTLTVAGGPPLVEMEREFTALGVPHRWIATESATRVCTTMIDRTDGKVTELVEEGRPISPAEIARYRHAYRQEIARADVAVITGSLPVGVPMALYREMVEQAECPAVLDFRGAGLDAVLDLEPYVVKPNREELGQTVGDPLETDARFCEAMRSLNRRGAQWVVVTQGDGPVWLSSASEFYRFNTPPVECVNPIGSGDCLAAGIAWATREGRNMVDAVKFGIAAAGENLGQVLPSRLDPRKVRARAAEVQVEEV